jgi:hypothetical protein
MPGLRQWARTNKDRIFLYEADVEQSLNLAEYYHVRTIPTLMAFDDNNLLTPIWQRTADNVLSTDPQSPIDEPELAPNTKEISHDFQEIFREKLDNSNNIFLLLDPSNRILKMIETSNKSKQEQYLIILDNHQSMPNKSKLLLAITSKTNKLSKLSFHF